MRGRGVDSQPAPLGKFLDVGVATGPAAQTGLADAAERAQRLVLRRGVVHVHHPGPQPPGDADATGLLPLLGCHATVLRVSSGHRWQALSRFLRNVPDASACAQGVPNGGGADAARGRRQRARGALFMIVCSWAPQVTLNYT